MECFSIENDRLSLAVINYGARIHQLTYKDNYGNQDVVISLDNIEHYINDTKSLNAVIGRFAGRICSNCITVDGVDYPLSIKEGIHLHGGTGFSNRNWNLEELNTENEPFIKLSYFSKHLEDGYPGNLKVTVTYRLINNKIQIELAATTDQNTLVNLTHHAYFKLDNSNKLNHLQFKIPADHLLELNSNLCPTGRLIELKDHQFNFNNEKNLEDLRLDSPFVIDNSKTTEVYSPITKMRIRATTDQNIAVVYTPDTNGSFCIETQNYPNSPNLSHFPTAELKAGEDYKNLCSFEFTRE